MKPEQSVPLVKLEPPYTYGLPSNCNAYATTAARSAEADDVSTESEICVLLEELLDEAFDEVFFEAAALRLASSAALASLAFLSASLASSASPI